MIVKSKGFTVIEVAVVMLIIAALGMMILPALSKAKERSQVATALSHLRQIGYALAIYRTENDGDGKFGSPSEMGLPIFAPRTVRFNRYFRRPLPCEFHERSDWIYWANGLEHFDPEPWQVLVQTYGESTPLVTTTDCTSPGVNRHSQYEQKLGLAIQLDMGLIKRVSTGDDSKAAFWKE